MELDYRTRGTCSSSIHVELDGRKIKRVVFTGGCNGNLQGISRLVEGMDIDEVIARNATYKEFEAKAKEKHLCRLGGGAMNG